MSTLPTIMNTLLSWFIVAHSNVRLQFSRPDGIALLVHVQSVAGVAGVEHVGAGEGEVGEDINIGDAYALAIVFQKGVYAGYAVGLSAQRAPCTHFLVYGQQTLHKEARAGGLGAYAVDNALYALENIFGGVFGVHVVYAAHEEDGTGMAGRDLTKPTQHALGIIAHDAVVANIVGVQTCVPVASKLGEAVAEHHYLGAVDVVAVFKLRNLLIVMLREAIAHVALLCQGAYGGECCHEHRYGFLHLLQSVYVFIAENVSQRMFRFMYSFLCRGLAVGRLWIKNGCKVRKKYNMPQWIVLNFSPL